MRSFYEGNYHTELQDPAFMDRAFAPKYTRYLSIVRPHLSADAVTLDVGCATGLFPKMLILNRTHRGIALCKSPEVWYEPLSPTASRRLG